MLDSDAKEKAGIRYSEVSPDSDPSLNLFSGKGRKISIATHSPVSSFARARPLSDRNPFLQLRSLITLGLWAMGFLILSILYKIAVSVKEEIIS